MYTPLYVTILWALSGTVAAALLLTGGTEASETAKFVDMFNNFFDCFNVSSFDAGKKQRNPFKAFYRSATDF